MAVSGQDGRALWLAPRGRDVREPPPDEQFRKLRSAALRPPLTVTDLNGDGAPDVIAVFGDVDAEGDYDVRPRKNPSDAALWVEALSGASGETLWRRDLDSEWFAPRGAEVPLAYRWLLESHGGSTNPALSPLGDSDRAARRRESPPSDAFMYVYMPSAPQLLRFGERNMLSVVAGSWLIALDSN